MDHDLIMTTNLARQWKKETRHRSSSKISQRLLAWTSSSHCGSAAHYGLAILQPGPLIKAAPEKLRPASEEEHLSLSGWLEGIGHAKKQFETDQVKGMIDLKKEQDTPPEDSDNTDDYWTKLGDYWVRVHENPRSTYFHPEDPAGQPLPFAIEDLEDWCRHEMILPNQSVQTEETTWKDKTDTATTVSTDLDREDVASAPRTTTTQRVKRPDMLPPPLRRVRQKATMHPEGNELKEERTGKSTGELPPASDVQMDTRIWNIQQVRKTRK